MDKIRTLSTLSDDDLRKFTVRIMSLLSVGAEKAANDLADAVIEREKAAHDAAKGKKGKGEE